MPLAPEQLAVTSLLVAVSSVASAVGIGIVLLYFVARPRWFDNLMGRLVLALVVADILTTVAKAVGRRGPVAGADAFGCQAQAVLIQYSNTVSAVISLVIAVTMLLIVFGSNLIFTLQRNERIVIALCFLLPVSNTVPLLLIKPDGVHNIIGDVDLWCWIAGQHAEYRIWLFYVPLWSIFIFDVVAYILTWAAIRRIQDRAARGRVTPAVIAIRRYNLVMTRRMQAYTLGFVLTWIPSTLNRLVPFFSGDSVYTLTVMQAIVSPLRGAVDCVVFLYIQHLLEPDLDFDAAATLSEVESSRLATTPSGLPADSSIDLSGAWNTNETSFPLGYASQSRYTGPRHIHVIEQRKDPSDASRALDANTTAASDPPDPAGSSSH
ncbi:hypothetical protein HK105_205526 [Polyrhizophydium stewartii]|uniref:G-protein coupled receptors family 1 profile domain-containing protein n=1 Tax=Polyrhizophydium stewartii TaxID=2732419 RepID=A0ABR4N616_9FUNG